jgi:hypothetical protein
LSNRINAAHAEVAALKERAYVSAENNQRVINEWQSKYVEAMADLQALERQKLNLQVRSCFVSDLHFDWFRFKSQPTPAFQSSMMYISTRSVNNQNKALQYQTRNWDISSATNDRNRCVYPQGCTMYRCRLTSTSH